MKLDNSSRNQIYIEQSGSFKDLALFSNVQNHLILGGIGLSTLIGMTILIREIRLLVRACKG